MGFDEHYRMRRELIDALERDLVGPSSDDEVIVDPPLTAYVAGILYPQRSGTIDPSQDVDAPEVDDDGMFDSPVSLANMRYPSSMGLTFAVLPSAAPRLWLRAKAARYEPVDAENSYWKEAHKDRPRHWRDAEPHQHWARHVVECEPVLLDVTIPRASILFDIADGLRLYARVRQPDSTGAVSVTAVLVNTRSVTPNQGLGDADAFFQVGIEVPPEHDGDAVFVERPASLLPGSDLDLKSTRLLYRHAREFAVGHGCSVVWEVAGERDDRAVKLRTTFIPECEVPVADSNPEIRNPSLAMRRLVEAPQADILSDLETLCASYEAWITGCETEVSQLDESLRETAERHLSTCRRALDRMRTGIETLRTDANAWEAFRLMNRAMLRQRARTVWLRNGRPAVGPVEDDDHLWRPFQLAFILLCNSGIADRRSLDRNIADLLWFPTGGGKTEAYLGLIAFTVFLRRLRRSSDGGVTALMRYTLRLLTIQQFERATLLICCCEELRRSNPRLGAEPISIGLWVGQDATPNTLDDAEDALGKLRSCVQPERGNPVQVHACPWCGTPLDYRNYKVHKAPDRRLGIACRAPGCAFATGLPVYVVDEDVYRLRPTLIISTVDKFASLPWREETTNLFNIGGATAMSPPELIIQDELHLISGPLGPLTGLYETAVDFLCTDAGVRPKVIASTATIRRAEEQAGGLFERAIAQFPPPGLDARNSYFAIQASPDNRGSRMYVGLMTPGTSHTTLLVRTYAALLQTAAELAADDTVKDAYWTLVGYFNSLRVLGGAVLQVQDDVNDRMELLARRAATKQRTIDQRIELTSRKSSADIPGYLSQMAVALPSSETLDVIFATNMISVGVDIDRLGLMVVMGQPQSTAEYIQSTSRVGRRHPGLVVVLFNAARSRDRSHYESFAAYHAALYRQVEPTSVTPFSARSRDRGLHAVLVALARLSIPGLRANDAAAHVARFLPQLEEVKQRIVERVHAVAPTEAEHAAAQLNELIRDWVARAREDPRLRYRDHTEAYPTLLVDPATEEAELQPGQFRTLWSLRDVDKESNLYLVQ